MCLGFPRHSASFERFSTSTKDRPESPKSFAKAFQDRPAGSKSFAQELQDGPSAFCHFAQGLQDGPATFCHFAQELQDGPSTFCHFAQDLQDGPAPLCHFTQELQDGPSAHWRNFFRQFQVKSFHKTPFCTISFKSRTNFRGAPSRPNLSAISRHLDHPSESFPRW